MKIKKRLEKSILIFDGAMGTMIQNSGLKLGELPELLNIHSPETIIDIHKSYRGRVDGYNHQYLWSQ